MDRPRSVLVSYGSRVATSPSSPQGYSGLLIAKDLVLTHGSILAPILNRSNKMSDFISALYPGELTTTMIPDELVKGSEFCLYQEKMESSQPSLGSRSHSYFETESKIIIEESCGNVRAIWKCPLLQETFDNSFRNWNFQKSTRFDRLLLPIFLLIKRNGAHYEKSKEKIEIERALYRLAKRASATNPVRGAPIEIVSTPFGNPLFAHSLSRGLVGNILGNEQCLILMDVNGFPGCEGGPVYLIANREERIICGMVIASLTWCRDEWVNYTFAVNFLPSLKRILRNRNDLLVSLRTTVFPGDSASHFGTLDRNVVVVSCGPNWGTGILIDEQTGTFVTCAHVVNDAPEREIKLTASTDQSDWVTWAKLIYKTPGNKPYDVAVLRIDPEKREPSLKAIKLADEPAQPGEQVLAVGFPFSSRPQATISGGVVSKSLSCMLQTSCCAQSGTSGAPVVRRNTHEMLGMLVCNAVSANGMILYPRLSMAIPATVLNGPLNNYLRTTDADLLTTLTQTDTIVETTWNLRPFLASNI